MQVPAGLQAGARAALEREGAIWAVHREDSEALVSMQAPLPCDLGQGPNSAAPMITLGSPPGAGVPDPHCAESPGTGTGKELKPSP